ncbi:MAG: hypothetical protein ABSG51_05755 [Terracidiphilus sp.]
MATSVLTTGCQQPQTESAPVASQPAPATNETVIYNKWETETHRPHKEIAQRTPDEQKEYNDWKQKQTDRH